MGTNRLTVRSLLIVAALVALWLFAPREWFRQPLPEQSEHSEQTTQSSTAEREGDQQATAPSESDGATIDSGPPDVPSLAAASAATEKAPKAKTSGGTNVRFVVPNVTVRDQSGRVVFQGEVDLTSTMRRIDQGQKLSFPHDGTVFKNRERLLPARADGHYREWVHPTPKLSGPGPQRVVTGKSGEAYYTHDHYRTFKRIR